MGPFLAWAQNISCFILPLSCPRLALGQEIAKPSQLFTNVADKPTAHSENPVETKRANIETIDELIRALSIQNRLIFCIGM